MFDKDEDSTTNQQGLDYRLHRTGVVTRADPGNPDEALGVLNPATARGPDSKLKHADFVLLARLRPG